MARLAIVGACLSLAVAAQAQLHRATDPVATPASSVIAQDDALAIDVNPAALGLLPSWSLAYVHAEVDQRASWLGRGDALYLGTPLLWGFALGGSLQSIRPDARAGMPPPASGSTVKLPSGSDRALGSFALAYAPSPRAAIGIATRTVASGDGNLDGLTVFDAGLIVRPSAWLSASLVGRDFFASRYARGTGNLDLSSSALLSFMLRPFASQGLSLELGLAMDADEPGRLGGRGGLTLEVPYVGALSGLVEVEDLRNDERAVRAVGELSLRWGGFTLGGGATGGDGFGGDLGWYAMARTEGRERSGLPPPGRILEVELGDVAPRTAIAAAIALERARIDERIAGVLLHVPGGGMATAYAQELRLQIRALRDAGKPVMCHLQSATGSQYYACAAANEVLIDRAGDIRLMGVSTAVLLFGDTLRDIGVHADFVRIGDYKSAPEQFTRREMSEPSREQTRALLDDVHRRMLVDLAGDLGITTERVASIMDEGPQLADRAVELGMVKGVADGFDLRDSDLALFEGRGRVSQLPADMAGRWGGGPYVGVVVVDDTIVEGENVDIPIIDVHMSGAKTIVNELDALAREPRVRAIVLRVDSPGGSVLASDQIWRAVRRARQRKPVIASLGAVAASGGYYVASAADEIWADPSTLTGSIGIFYGKVDVAELADKLDIGVEHFSRGRRADAESLFRPFTPDERAALSELIRKYYRLFLDRVAEGRGMKAEEVDQLGQGRVYSGDAALSLGLVDKLGGLGSAIVRARQRGDLPRDAEVVVKPARANKLLDFVLRGQVAAHAHEGVGLAGEATVIPQELQHLLRLVATMRAVGGGTPLALMPYEIDF